MDKTLFYSLPKDVLIELLCKVYGNLDGFSMQDIHRLHKICQTKMEEERQKKEEENEKIQRITWGIHEIDNHLYIYQRCYNRIFIIDNRITHFPRFESGRYYDTTAILDITFEPEHVVLTRNYNGLIDWPGLKCKSYKELTPYIIQHLKLYEYNDEIIEKSFNIIKLIRDITDAYEIKNKK